MQYLTFRKLVYFVHYGQLWRTSSTFLGFFRHDLVPAVIMSFAIPSERPQAATDVLIMKRGARRTMVLFLLTITTAVLGHNVLHLVGMMMELAYLRLLGCYLLVSFARCCRTCAGRRSSCWWYAASIAAHRWLNADLF